MNARNAEEAAMERSRVQQMWLAIVTAIFIVAVAAVLAEAKTLNVANNGIDSPTCGDKNNPCRSLSKVIANASPGDKIIVGPGLYGDLNHNGTFEPLLGEENANMFISYMIKIDKQLSIESRDGAGVTVLDAGGINVAVVEIAASGVVFGKNKKGFTLTHSGAGVGLSIGLGTSGVRVEGNLATANKYVGFFISGNGHQIVGNTANANDRDGFVLLAGNGHQLSGNTANANGTNGFNIVGSGHVLSGNSAVSNHASGFHSEGSELQLNGNLAIANDESGFFIGVGRHHLNGNVASANGLHGFVVDASGQVFTGNLVQGNHFHGFLIASGTGQVLTGNSILGNGDFGIYLVAGTSATVTKNNIFGNNLHPNGGFTNCGLINQSGGAINAINNFWGVVTGPSPTEPADDVCNDGAGSSTTFAPVSTKEFKVKTVSPLEEPGLIAPADPGQSEIPQAPSLTPVQFLRELQTKEGLLFRALGDVSALQLEIVDLSGRRVYDSSFVKGQVMTWTRVNSQNKPIASGVYLYRLTARDRDGREIHSELRKLVIGRFFE